jgi:hypothetical protein
MLIERSLCMERAPQIDPKGKWEDVISVQPERLIVNATRPAARTRVMRAIAVNGNTSLGFACDLKGERDTNNLICVPATGQVNRL